MRISDWSSDVCSSDLGQRRQLELDDGDEQLHRENEEGEDDDRPGEQQHRDNEEIVEEGRKAHEFGDLLEQRPCGLEPNSGETAGLQQIIEIGRASCRERVCEYV